MIIRRTRVEVYRQMYDQTTYPKSTAIPRWGCYMMSALWIAGAITGKWLGRKKILTLYDRAMVTEGRYKKNVLSIDSKGLLWANDIGVLFDWACAEAGWEGDFIGDDNTFFMDTGWYKGMRTRAFEGVALDWERPPTEGGVERNHYTALIPEKNMAHNPDDSLKLVRPSGKFSLFYARMV